MIAIPLTPDDFTSFLPEYTIRNSCEMYRMMCFLVS